MDGRSFRLESHKPETQPHHLGQTVNCGGEVNNKAEAEAERKAENQSGLTHI